MKRNLINELTESVDALAKARNATAADENKVNMNDEQTKKIKQVRTKVLESQEINNRLYSELREELGLKKYCRAEEFLFDAIFNSEKEADFEYYLQECRNTIEENNQ